MKRIWHTFTDHKGPGCQIDFDLISDRFRWDLWDGKLS